jgi:glycylpeptide N-tetradecanoyltransferase
VGVRNSKNGKLLGFITAVPVHIHIHDAQMNMAEINFLCVHKKLRYVDYTDMSGVVMLSSDELVINTVFFLSVVVVLGSLGREKRLAPVLIKEITRRVNLTDTWQAVYTAGVVLPRPVSSCTYYHRSINVKKLIEVKFSHLPATKTMQSHIKSLKLPTKLKCSTLRPMTEADVPGVHKLLGKYLMENTKLSQMFSEADVAHMLLPRLNVINSLVIETDGIVTDLCSFYHLPSTIIGNVQHNKLNAVYSYYNVATTLPLLDLMTDCLGFARNLGADVFNALDLMENKVFLEQLQFGKGNGCLQYYLYNWKCPQMEAEDVGIVLV